jgi:polyribonucleotide nucleotidyltransferase
VKLLDMDRDGKMKLSRRVLLPKPEGMPDRPERSNEDRPPRRDDNRGGCDRRDNRGGGDHRGGDRRDNRDRR